MKRQLSASAGRHGIQMIKFATIAAPGALRPHQLLGFHWLSPSRAITHR